MLFVVHYLVTYTSHILTVIPHIAETKLGHPSLEVKPGINCS